jgi:hypothetical protein
METQNWRKLGGVKFTTKNGSYQNWAEMPKESLEERLKPYEQPIMRAQQVLLVEHPIAFAGLVIIALITLFYCKSAGTGVLATLSLLACICYAALIAWAFAGPRLEEVLFSKQCKDTLTFSEICQGLEGILGLFEARKGKFLGGLALILAFVLRKFSGFTISLVLLLACFILPRFIAKAPACEKVRAFLQKRK